MSTRLIKLKAILGSGLLLVLSGCGSEEIPEIPCESSDDLEVICGFAQPEDIEPVPGGRYLVISEMSPFGAEAEPGALSVYDLESEQRQLLPIRREAEAAWGDAACEAPASLEFSPHGIHLSNRADGAMQLLVVSHYPREAVEVMELAPTQDGMELIWRSCLIPPGKPLINDVTAVSDGTVLMTHMWDIDTPQWRLYLTLFFGIDTGYVYSWSPQTGYGKVANSEGSMPNGIASGKSPDIVYVNHYFDHRTRAINFRTGEILATYEVQMPDNVSYADGSLYIASHETEPLESLNCGERATNCPLPFAIHRIDADTLTGGRIFSSAGEPFGLGTVGVPGYGWLWMGSYLGDRIARVPLSELPPASQN